MSNRNIATFAWTTIPNFSPRRKSRSTRQASCSDGALLPRKFRDGPSTFSSFLLPKARFEECSLGCLQRSIVPNEKFTMKLAHCRVCFFPPLWTKHVLSIILLARYPSPTAGGFIGQWFCVFVVYLTRVFRLRPLLPCARRRFGTTAIFVFLGLSHWLEFVKHVNAPGPPALGSRGYSGGHSARLELVSCWDFLDTTRLEGSQPEKLAGTARDLAGTCPRTGRLYFLT